MNSGIWIGKQTRFFLLWVALIVWIGIIITGMQELHWFLYNQTDGYKLAQYREFVQDVFSALRFQNAVTHSLSVNT